MSIDIAKQPNALHWAPVSPPLIHTTASEAEGCTCGDSSQREVSQQGIEGILGEEEEENAFTLANTTAATDLVDTGAPVFLSTDEPTEYEKRLENLRLR